MVEHFPANAKQISFPQIDLFIQNDASNTAEEKGNRLGEWHVERANSFSREDFWKHSQSRWKFKPSIVS